MDAHSRPDIGSQSGASHSNGDYKIASSGNQTKGPLPAIATTMKRNITGPSVSSLISPPDTHRSTQEDPDSAHSIQARHSLPSIHEALLSHSDMSHSQSSHCPSSYAPLNTPAHTPNSPNSVKRLRPTELSQRESDYKTSQPSTNNNYITNANYSNSSSQSQSQPPPQPPLSSMSSRPSGWTSSPAPTREQVPYGYQAWQPYPSARHEFGARAGPAQASQHSYAQPAPPYRSSGPAFPPTSAPTHIPTPYASNWRPREDEEDMKKFERSRPAQYGDSVKRHLDSFDLDNSLNDIAEAGTRIMKFTEHYQQQSFLASRSGPTLDSIPAMIEVDDMSKQTLRMQDSIARLRGVVQAQEEAEIAERTKEHQAKERSLRHEEINASSEDLRGAALIGSDAKKRRGRAAPPGRCHSCNRAETPEWRRGPDGARTLCNACGLHYAKLTRKAASKTSLTSSSLRPKSLEPGSPPA
ncbi:MAG: hypothetical protein M1828_004059 [Chrysothrix sp. TS-e1954]|nr:MAG: hypothetical protein M1828_004059 [Chrysothrix sp. TS-e1954]